MLIIGEKEAASNTMSVRRQSQGDVGSMNFDEFIAYFNKEAEIAMGCNIHDWMSGYLLIVDTPFFTKSDKNGDSEIIIDINDMEHEMTHLSMDLLYKLKI